MTEERPERLRHRKDELSMGELEQNLIGQMLGEMAFKDGMEFVATTGTYRSVAMLATEIARLT